MRNRLCFELYAWACAALTLLSAPGWSLAQDVPTEVVRDGSIGPDASVQPIGTPLPEGGTLFVIGEDLGQRSADQGALFHSFDRFQIAQGDTVQFQIERLARTRHVIARVTGGARSDIFGRLELFPGFIAPGGEGLTEFYLVNPAGILFGPGGSVTSPFPFIATTADALELKDGAVFEAGLGAPPPILSVAKVAAFDFRTSTGSITADGAQLNVLNGAIGLVAGTPGTRIGLNTDDKDLLITSISTGAVLGIIPVRTLVSLSLLSPGSAPASNGEGQITVRRSSLSVAGGNTSRNFFRFGDSALFAGSAIDVQESLIDLASGQAARQQLLSTGHVSIVDSLLRGPEVDISGTGIDLTRFGLVANLVLTSRGDRIRIRDSVLLTTSATLTSDVGISFEGSSLMAGGGFPSPESVFTFSSDNPGTIALDAPSIELDRSTISTTFAAEAVAKSGDISIRADRVRLSGQSVLSTQALAAPRRVTLESGTPVSSFLAELGDGASKAGSISILAGDIELLDSRIASSVAIDSNPPVDPFFGEPPTRLEDFSIGSAGQIRLEAAGAVQLTNSQLDTSSVTQRSSQLGSISIAAATVQLEGSTVTSTSVDTQAGNISVRSGRELLLRDTSLTSNASGSGGAGSVSVSGSAIRLEQESALLSSNTGVGPAGSVRVEPGSGSLTLSERSTISTRAEVGPAPGQPADGNIDVQLDGSLLLQDASSINASVGLGQGGDIRITAPQSVVMRNGSAILAGTGDGQGGRIDVSTGAFLVDSTSSVNADAGVGASGTVQIRSPDVDLQGGIAGLSAEFLNTSALLRPSCEARAEGASSLYVASARGLPTSPDDWLLAFDASPALPDVSADAQRAPEAVADAGTRGELMRVARSQQAGGAYAESLTALESALAQAEQAKDAGRVAAVLGALGNAQQALGRDAAAEVLLTRGTSLARERGDASLAARLEHDLGNHYASAGAAAKARESYARAAELAERSGDALGAAWALAGASRLALESGEDAAALLDRADARIGALSDGVAKAELLIHVGRSRAEQARRAVSAELHDRSLLRAHDRLQSAGKLALVLDAPRLRAYALGNLAELYQSERRFGEALALTREALAQAERAQASDALYRWQWLEGQLLWALGKAEPAVQAYRRAVQILEETRQESRARYGARSGFFRRALAPVYLDLADALLRGASSREAAQGRDALLLEARATVEKLKAAELRNYLRDDCSAQLEARTASLDSLAIDAAVVYPIALRDRLELLVRLPSGLERFTVPVAAEEIEAEARAFRLLVQDRTSSAYRPVARKLYDWLVRPYAAQLAATEVQTLVFVPDGALGTIPMAALHDGEHYLAERFALATAPGLSLVDARPLDVEGVKPLIGGVSQSVQEFAALGSVPSELEAIRGLFGGEVLLDASFQAARIQNAVQEARPTLVHLASHAVFTGDPATSFLLTHDGRITMDELGALLSRTRFRSDPIELLVLSACETAVGDERAALGLAGVAVRAGARSALGSLWTISDEATYPLVVHFYGRLHESGVSRADALRHAQRALLASPRFSHPFYWSPFVLISNWL